MSARPKQATRGAGSGRFPRPGVTPRRSPATKGRTVPRPPMHLGRRPPQKATEKALGRLKAVVPGSGAGTKTSRRGASGATGTAGLAALAGATAFAFKNREKLTGLLNNRKKAPDTTSDMHPPTAPPADDLPPAA